MVIMDTSIIGVALPEMQADLGFTPQGLSWVFNAYVVAFGGLLLLGGRLSDLFGARRIFSDRLGRAGRRLAAGRPGRQRRGRAGRPGCPGRRLGAHRPGRADLAVHHFGANPKELTKALALYGAAAPAGGTAGVFLGGVLTEYASWPWVFFINLPLALVGPGPDSVGDARRAPRQQARWTWPVRSRRPVAWPPWCSRSSAPRRPGGPRPPRWSAGLGGLALLGVFVYLQARLPAAADAAGDLQGAQPGGSQHRPVLARCGVDPDVLLPQPLPPAGARAGRVRQRRCAAAADGDHHGRDDRGGSAADRALRSQGHDGHGPGHPRRRAGVAAQLRPDGSFAVDVLPATLVTAAGMAMAFIPSLGLALSSAAPEEGGLAAGIVNTNYQVGSALGLAAMTAVAAAFGADQVGDLVAMTDGFSAGPVRRRRHRGPRRPRGRGLAADACSRPRAAGSRRRLRLTAGFTTCAAILAEFVVPDSGTR